MHRGASLQNPWKQSTTRSLDHHTKSHPTVAVTAHTSHSYTPSCSLSTGPTLAPPYQACPSARGLPPSLQADLERTESRDKADLSRSARIRHITRTPAPVNTFVSQHRRLSCNAQTGSTVPRRLAQPRTQQHGAHFSHAAETGHTAHHPAPPCTIASQHPDISPNAQALPQHPAAQGNRMISQRKGPKHLRLSPRSPLKDMQVQRIQIQAVTTDSSRNLQTCPIIHRHLPQCPRVPASPTLTSEHSGSPRCPQITTHKLGPQRTYVPLEVWT